ncbi:uncharacterized protein BXZ73DRAFT_106330 [Epithele typhae]|uniref:uncharacterized protein n=1 Tax=Epithele typhae TaxID=378194 RepID=UPI0020076A1F|nr:uncharacterized protein BXZ73DRAFT_106330 [Epithele typhae]KAH9915019.1 hypothetical protein BXZ73DRAFT_106330 [Epithele typhae]
MQSRSNPNIFFCPLYNSPELADLKMDLLVSEDEYLNTDPFPFSKDGLFVYHATGQGGVTSRTIQPGERWIADNGLAWTAQSKVELISQGFLLRSHTDEGIVYRSTGPEMVYIQLEEP